MTGERTDARRPEGAGKTEAAGAGTGIAAGAEAAAGNWETEGAEEAGAGKAAKAEAAAGSRKAEEAEGAEGEEAAGAGKRAEAGERRERNVTVARTAGFCFGVRRAVDKVYEQIRTAGKPIYTYGPIIHNEEVVKDLKARGVTVIDSKEELAALTDGVVVIRSHGVGREIYELLAGTGVDIVDATCPYVKKIHRIVERQCREGRRVIIVGNETHPEVVGIRGWGNKDTEVIKNEHDFENLVLPEGEKLCIVAQTTFNYNKFQDLVEKISKKRYDIVVLNTICNATQERQVEAKELASRVDLMIVIGDRNSSNTQKLYEICRAECKNTCYIQTLDDLNPECVTSACNVGITAGASTPNNIIEEVHTNVRIKF